MKTDILQSARDLLKDVTPLKADCGLYCDRACCKDTGEAGSCVWLLPGEDGESMNWGKQYKSEMPVTKASVRALYCAAPCERDFRPFLCRIFPLTPYFSDKKQLWSVRMDRRAAAVCPMYGCGKKGLRADFVKAAEEAVQILASDAEYEAFLKRLEAEETAYRMTL